MPRPLTRYAALAALLLGPGAANAKDAAPRPLTFTHTGPGVRQRLTVKQVDDKTIEFTIKREGTCKRTETGKAIKQYRDVEADDKGNAYGVDVFSLDRDKTCAVFLRIRSDKQDHATISEAPACAQACQFYSNGPMERVK